MLKTFEIKLDVEKVIYSPMQILFNVSSNDFDSINLEFEIIQDGEPFDLTGRTIQLAIKNPSGKVSYQSIESTDPINGKASARLTQNAYVESGIHTAEVYVKSTNETIVISPFYFNSWESITATETVDDGTTGDVYWNNILNKPFTFPPDAHLHAIADVSGLQSALDSKADEGTTGGGDGTLEAHTHPISEIIDLQTTLDGKADDVDLAGKSDVGHSHDFTTEITGKPSAYPPEIHTHDFVDIQGKPATYPSDPHVHTIGDVTNLSTTLDGKMDDGDAYLKIETYTKSEVYNKGEIDQMTFDGGGSSVIVEDNLTSTSTTNALSSNQGRILDESKAPTDHTHDFASITDKPLTYPPDLHSHAIGDITDLTTILEGKADDEDLAGKSDVGHVHDFASITDKPLTYPPDLHSHAIGDVTDLQLVLDGKVDDAELDGKADAIHTHDFASITDKPLTYPPDAHGHTSAEITDFGTAVSNAIPTEYLTQSEGDARYQATGTISAHDHTTADITDFETRMNGLSLWKGTQIEYDGLTPDPNTLYFIVG